MKFTKETLEILKNFANINRGIEFREGNVLKTMHPQKVILAEAHISEKMPINFAIYDLNRFLNIESLLEDPDFNFSVDSVKITDGNKTVNYRASDPSMITLPPNKEFVLPKSEVEFSVSEDDYNSVLRAANILGLNNIAVVGDGKTILLKAVDNKSKDDFVLDTKVSTNKKFNILFKVENLMLMNGAYDICITKKAGLFKNKNRPVKYWVTLEPGSTFN